MHQFLVEQRRDGSYRRSILIEFRDGTPVIVDHDPELMAPIVPISSGEFRRQLTLLRDERTPKTKQARNARYRQSIQARRVQRAERHVSSEIQSIIASMLNEGKTGVAISIATGVSTSYVSTFKKLRNKKDGEG